MFVIWGRRLATYLLRDRVVGRQEDPRYADLRARGARPVVASTSSCSSRRRRCSRCSGGASPDRGVQWRTAAGAAGVVAVLLWAAALSGEALADHQLERFKARPGIARPHLSRRAVALLAPSQLLLRMGRMGGLCALRARVSHGRTALALMSPAADALPAFQGHRHPRDGGAGDPQHGATTTAGIRPRPVRSFPGCHGGRND